MPFGLCRADNIPSINPIGFSQSQLPTLPPPYATLIVLLFYMASRETDKPLLLSAMLASKDKVALMRCDLFTDS